MDRIIRVVIAIIAISLSSVSIAAIPRQSLIAYEDFNNEELNRVKTIALLQVSDPAYYNFSAEDLVGASFVFIEFLMGSVGKRSGEYGEFGFGKTAQGFLKQFLSENSYEVIEYPVTRQNKYGLLKNYQNLNIEGADAYLDVALVEVGYKQKPVPFSELSGPHVSIVARLVSAKTGEFIYEGTVQYGWGTNPLVSGKNIDSPEDHQYETPAQLNAQKEQAIDRLVRGIEVVSLNIAKNITMREFVSTLSPTMEDAMGNDANQASIEFIGIAATEIAAKTYDETLWRQSAKFAGEDAVKQSGIYIKLRSQQLAEKDKREQQKLAKLTSADPQKSEFKTDVSGTYISRLNISDSRGSRFGKKYRKMKITLEQAGNKISGIDRSGEVEIKGTREGNVINFRVISATKNWGVWKINADASQLEGKWNTTSAGGSRGKWNLIRVQ